jgi:hypothetical protein
MKLEPTEDDALLEPLTDGKVIMGLWPVLFGWRIRAGFKGQMYYQIDWCCGDDVTVIWATYEMMRCLLENGTDINTLRPHSNIKPWPKDNDFGNWLIDQVKQYKRVMVITDRPSLDKLREEYMKKLAREF